MADEIFKVVIVGGQAAGNTNIMKRYTGKGFPSTQPTVGVDLGIKSVTINGRNVTLQLWDINALLWRIFLRSSTDASKAVQAAFRAASGVVVVYDITDRATFSEAVECLPTLKERVGASTPIVLVGSKCDLEDSRQVYIEEGDSMARLHGVKFLETSAKEDVNVTRAFDLLIALMLCAEPRVTPTSAVSTAA
jgi:small GTP-binding protein